MGTNYFDTEELFELKAVEQKILARVIYHLWQNKINPEETFEFLDKLELIFTDGKKIFLSANEETPPGIIVLKDFDAEKNRLLLLHQFQGRIDHASEELTENGLWALVVGKKLRKVGVIDEGENCYLNDAVLLDFGDEKMEIHPALEGLIVEPYENV
ncbi:MAG: hypothetical protein M3R17_04225 [Bacteroidota bacterium]|nr:hypothetical protein [Bacteroidota bacterium]